MYLHRTELGPFYKEPIFALVYTVVVNNPDDYMNIPEQYIPEWIGRIAVPYINIYLHNRLQQVDAEV